MGVPVTPTAAGGDSVMTRWFQRNTALLTFVGLIVAGIVLHQVSGDWLPWHWLSSAVTMLADALVVAGILGGTVDYFLKRALIRDVGSIFIGWALPNEVKTYIRKVSQTDFVRRNYRVHYKLALDPDGEEVTADVTESWDVFNYGTGVISYRSSFAADLHEKPDRSATRCERIHAGKTKSWNADDLNNLKRVKESRGVVTWTLPLVRLYPQNGNDPDLRPACCVRWQYRLRMPIHYSTVISFTSPAIGVTVTADCPAGLTFDCDQDDQTQHAEGSNEWRIDRLYMPGQVLRVRWNRVS